MPGYTGRGRPVARNARPFAQFLTGSALGTSDWQLLVVIAMEVRRHLYLVDAAVTLVDLHLRARFLLRRLVLLPAVLICIEQATSCAREAASCARTRAASAARAAQERGLQSHLPHLPPSRPSGPLSAAGA